MIPLPQLFADALQALQDNSSDLAVGLALSLAALVALGLLRWLLRRALDRRSDDAVVLYRGRKFLNYSTAAVGLGLLALIWFERLRLALTLLGLLSAGIALALSGLIAAMTGWVFILVRRPFEVGDRIQVGEYAGDVIDIRLFKTVLMEIGNWVEADQSTGRVIYLPNGKVLTETLINYTRGFTYIWDELPVRITFESDWEKAKGILKNIADRHAAGLTEEARLALKRASHRYLLHYSHLTPTVYTRVDDRGVVLTVRHLVLPRQRRGMAQALWEDILRAIRDSPDIELAYPTVRYFHHGEESELSPPGPAREPARPSAAEGRPGGE